MTNEFGVYKLIPKTMFLFDSLDVRAVPVARPWTIS